MLAKSVVFLLAIYKGNTVYHVIPYYASDDAESVLNKLRRMIAKNLEEM